MFVNVCVFLLPAGSHRLPQLPHRVSNICILWVCFTAVYSVFICACLFVRYSKLQYRKLSAEVPVQFRVVELPQTRSVCRVKSLNKGDANSEVTVYYQV